VLVVHLIGAFLCFASGVTYACLQVVISYRMHPLYNGISCCRIRLGVTLVLIASFLISKLAILHSAS